MKLILPIVLLFCSSSFAYQSTMNTGEVTKAGRYRLLGELQYITDPRGLNLVAGMDTGITEDSDLRVIAGTGSVNVMAGIAYKWIPFPDVDNQPAMGLIASATYARWSGENYPGMSIAPLASKKFDTDYGFITPYASLPFGVVAGPQRNRFPLTITGGTEWKPVDMEGWQFLAEFGIELNESASYISAGAIYNLPE